MDKQEAIDFAKASVRAARGCVSDFGSLEEALDAYRDNLQDTLNEKGASAHVAALAHEAFDREASGQDIDAFIGGTNAKRNRSLRKERAKAQGGAA